MLGSTATLRREDSVTLIRHRIAAFALPAISFAVLGLGAARAGAAWSSDPTASLPICLAPLNQLSPAGAPDGLGGAYLAWTDFRSGSPATRVFAQHVDAGGTLLWGPAGQAICAAAGREDLPRVSADGAGGLIVVWRDFRADTAGDLYGQRLDPAGNALWGANGAVVTAIPLIHPRYHAITPDGTGGVIVAWQDDRATPGDHVYAQRLDGLGNARWATDGEAICPVTAYQEAPALDADGAGGAVIAWTDERNGTWMSAHAQRVDSTGAALWDPAGIGLCSSTADQFLPAVASDDRGGATFAWMDGRSHNGWSQIFSQRADGTGAVQWITGGLNLSGSALPYSMPVAVGDDTGGAIVVWQSDDFGIGTTYAQRLNAAGTALWAPLGVEVGAGHGASGASGSVAASDGAGGIVCAWTDTDAGSTAILAQRIGAGGAALWGGSGALLATAPNLRFELTLAPTPGGGAIAAWADFRDAVQWDLYAARVNGSGVLSVPRAAPAGALFWSWPSPARAGEGVTFALRPAAPGIVTVRLYDAGGRRVCALDGAVAAGPVELRWNGRDAAGRAVAPGLYFARAEAAHRSATARIVVVR